MCGVIKVIIYMGRGSVLVGKNAVLMDDSAIDVTYPFLC